MNLANTLEQSHSAYSEEQGILQSQAEMPFVPASQRGMKTSAVSTVDDSIVVVGQARQKKRKRVKDNVNSNDNPTKANDKMGMDAIPYDFASAPNMLDASPAAEQSSIPRKKAKQGKSIVFFSQCNSSS